MKIKIISPGPLSTVQDEGRFGYMNTGFSQSGAMDSYSMRLANILVGNAQNEGVIEMTASGVSAEFDCEGVIALTGADMKPTLNGEDINMYEAIQVKAKDVLALKSAARGMRTYLSVAGGFDLPYVMGSLSTNLKCKVGGFEGRKLMRGDEIPLRQKVNLSFFGKRKIEKENDYKNEITLRILKGPQDDYFTQKGLEAFTSCEYAVTEKSDRMGIRLDGEKIESKNGVDIISDGIAFGSVQIPASGTPIIMMADRQTTGGYAKIGTVSTVDLKLIAQARPGTKVHFRFISEEESLKLLKVQEKKLKLLEYSMIYAK